MSQQQAVVSPSMEVFSTSDERIAEVVRKCPKWSREQFKQNVKPCDVVIAYKREKFLPGLVDKIMNFVSTKLIQRNSFASCKMINRDATAVIGYGVDANAKTNISSLKFEKFFAQHEAALILRYKGINDAKRAKILEEFYKHVAEDTSYDSVGIVTKGILSRFFGTIGKPKSDKEFSETDQKKLVCTTLVLLSYLKAGCPIQHQKDVGDKWIMPYEYILSPSFTVVGSYWSKDSGVKKTGLEPEVKDPEKDVQPEIDKEKMDALFQIDAEQDKMSESINKVTNLIGQIREYQSILNNIRTARDIIIMNGKKAIDLMDEDGSISALCGVTKEELTPTLVIESLTASEKTALSDIENTTSQLNEMKETLVQLRDSTKSATGYLSVVHQRAGMLLDECADVLK